MKHIILFLTMLVGLATFAADAQTKTADRLYSQGLTCMKTLTVSNQNKAIGFFTKARAAYDSKSRKDLCSKQIEACRSIIARLQKKDGQRKRNGNYSGKVLLMTDSMELPEKPKEEPVELSTAVSELTFDAQGGTSMDLVVKCNFTDWVIKDCPSWVKPTPATSLGKIILVADKNTQKAERVAVLVIECRGKRAEVFLKQEAKESGLQKLNPFKGKKKK